MADGGSQDVRFSSVQGVVATHPPQRMHSALVAPATSNEFNRIEEDLAPIACVRINDSNFDFESSVVLPDVSAELQAFAALRQAKPSMPASIFGHADPVGKDEYNKLLSGRRAQAIYAMLTRNVALWEDLFSTRLAGSTDDWGTRSLQTMLKKLGFHSGQVNGAADGATADAIKAFQKSKGLGIDGIAGKGTRPRLFEAYMDAVCVDPGGKPFKLDPKGDFLAQGADAQFKGDFQGCGEFNPVLVFSLEESEKFAKSGNQAERNRENLPNRRVLIFLFRPGTRVDPAAWPCPRAKEATAGCRKRFFVDGDRRRAFQNVRRDYATTRATYACRFYDRIARVSPCEILSVDALILHELVLEWTDDLTALLPADLVLHLTTPAGEHDAVWKQAAVVDGFRRIVFERLPVGIPCSLEAVSKDRRLRLWTEQVPDDPDNPPLWEHVLEELLEPIALDDTIEELGPQREVTDLVPEP